jgi:hypothetical protein
MHLIILLSVNWTSISTQHKYYLEKQEKISWSKRNSKSLMDVPTFDMEQQ